MDNPINEEARLWPEKCVNCGQTMLCDGFHFFLPSDDDQWVAVDYCSCGEWLGWYFQEGAGGPLGWWR